MSDMYFDERMETLSPDTLLKLQDHRLRWQFRRCWDGSQFYRARFEAAGLSPETFGGLADLLRLSVLTEEELAETPRDDWRVAPVAWVTSEHQGTSGRNLTRALTRTDEGHVRQRSERARIAGNAAETSGLTLEGVDSWLAYPCGQSEGAHWVADQFLAEIVDPKTRKPATAGSRGELLVTDLVREGCPLIRYATSAPIALTDAPCPCGRTSPRVVTE